MTLQASAKSQNLKASIEKYISDNLAIEEELSIDFEGLPFETSHRNEWVQERIMDTSSNTQYNRHVSSQYKGKTSDVLLSLNVFVNKENAIKTNRHFELRDIVAGYFEIGTMINMYDSSKGNFDIVIQKMKVREIVTDSPIPNNEGYLQYNYTVAIEWLQEWS